MEGWMSRSLARTLFDYSIDLYQVAKFNSYQYGNP